MYYMGTFQNQLLGLKESKLAQHSLCNVSAEDFCPSQSQLYHHYFFFILNMGHYDSKRYLNTCSHVIELDKK